MCFSENTSTSRVDYRHLKCWMGRQTAADLRFRDAQMCLNWLSSSSEDEEEWRAFWEVKGSRKATVFPAERGSLPHALHHRFSRKMRINCDKWLVGVFTIFISSLTCIYYQICFAVTGWWYFFLNNEIHESGIKPAGGAERQSLTVCLL